MNSSDGTPDGSKPKPLGDDSILGGPGNLPGPRGNGSTPGGRLAPSPDAGLTEVQRLSSLLHEIRNLLDGSLRYVLLARRALTDAKVDPPINEVSRQLDVATQAMERMSSLTHAAMQGPGLSLGSMLQSHNAAITLAEAVRHAVEVTRPRAEEHRVTIRSNISPRLTDLPAGAMYTLFLNTLRNAVDANVRAGGLGSVEISVSPNPAPTASDERLWMAVNIKDEGEGILPQVAQRAFEYAYSGTPFGTGIGLAVARSVVEEMGGTISIATRRDRGVITRPGACVHALIPIPSAHDQPIGDQRGA
jgi:two-component system nitrogen regulation sensor histidine kinase GlnL